MTAVATMTIFDEARASAFEGRMVGMLNAGALALMISIGHRTGLFDTLSAMPPATSEAIADRAGLNERYVREWLGAMTVGGIVAGLVVVLLAIVANLFLQMPALSLAISSVAVMLMCGMILFETSRLIHDGNANPVFIVVSLFSSFVVLFSHLLNLFALLSGDD